jgi:hypothetical protein
MLLAIGRHSANIDAKSKSYIGNTYRRAMKRKETESEKEIAEKWKDVKQVHEAYDESLLPETLTPQTGESTKKSPPPSRK